MKQLSLGLLFSKLVIADQQEVYPLVRRMRRLKLTPRAIKAREWRNLHPKAESDYGQRLKRIVLLHYSEGTLVCSCCGESNYEFLSIDHVNGGGTQHRKRLSPDGMTNRSGRTFYKWLIKNNFPPGYRVLCLNCNWARGKLGYCPHETSK